MSSEQTAEKGLGIKNLDIYLTGKCNYCCRYCFGEDESCGSMTADVYAAAIKFAAYIAAENIEFCGGEPLMCPEVEDRIVWAKKAGFHVVLRSNGILIEHHLQCLAKNCTWVCISLDGLPEVNALMRTSRKTMTAEEQFTKPIEAIFALKKLNPELRILLASLASKKNYQFFPAFSDYLLKNHVPIDKWKIYEFICDKFRSVANQQEFAMSEEEFRVLRQSLPETVNAAPVLLQSARGERASANCLIVFQNGDIKLLGKNYGNVAKTPFDKIVHGLLADNALAAIKENKEMTYGTI